MSSTKQSHEHTLHQVRLPNDFAFEVFPNGLYRELNGGVLIRMLLAYDCHKFVNPNESAKHCSLQWIKVYRYRLMPRHSVV